MKVNRDQLKKIVKECLIEILNEGLGDVSASAAVPSRHVEQRSHVQPTPQRNVYAEAVRNVAAGDQNLASVLADTAVTTMPGFMAGQGNSSALQQVEQINGTPEQVFGEDATTQWANLAFSAPKANAMNVMTMMGLPPPPPPIIQAPPPDAPRRR